MIDYIEDLIPAKVLGKVLYKAASKSDYVTIYVFIKYSLRNITKQYRAGLHKRINKLSYKFGVSTELLDIILALLDDNSYRDVLLASEEIIKVVTINGELYKLDGIMTGVFGIIPIDSNLIKYFIN